MRKLYAGLLAVLVACLVFVALWNAAPAARAAVNTLRLDWFVVAGGGGDSSNNNIVLNGTAGQAAASTLRGGPYALEGGYWSRAGAPLKAFLPIAIVKH